MVRWHQCELWCIRSHDRWLDSNQMIVYCAFCSIEWRHRSRRERRWKFLHRSMYFLSTSPRYYIHIGTFNLIAQRKVSKRIFFLSTALPSLSSDRFRRERNQCCLFLSQKNNSERACLSKNKVVESDEKDIRSIRDAERGSICYIHLDPRHISQWKWWQRCEQYGGSFMGRHQSFSWSLFSIEIVHEWKLILFLDWINRLWLAARKKGPEMARNERMHHQ